MLYVYIGGILDAMLAIRLDSETETRLNRLAKKTGRTKTFYAREAILEHLADLEDIYLATERLRRPGKTWSAKEVKRDIGSIGSTNILLICTDWHFFRSHVHGLTRMALR